jgi:hypothetical protein
VATISASSTFPAAGSGCMMPALLMRTEGAQAAEISARHI